MAPKKIEDEVLSGEWKYLTTWERRAMYDATDTICRLHEVGKERKEAGAPVLWSRATAKVADLNLKQEEKFMKEELKKLKKWEAAQKLSK